MAKQDPPATSRLPGYFLKRNRSTEANSSSDGSEVLTVVQLRIPFLWDMPAASLDDRLSTFRRNVAPSSESGIPGRILDR